MPDIQRQFALDVVKQLQQTGHQAFWAGGCVRDLVMGNEPDDYDVATSARPEQVQQLFHRTLAIGASFGVILVRGRRDNEQVEVATFRSDVGYSDGRHPDRVEFSTPEADAQRRDFTINGMFFDPVREQLHDFVGGRADIERKVLRAIGDPAARFAEDRLRMLRAARFSARFGFDIDSSTDAAIRKHAASILSDTTGVSAERIQQELRKLLIDPNRVRGLQLCDRLGLLDVILPEVHEMHGIPQGKPVQPHGDLWEHTLLVIDKLGEAWTTTVERLALAAAPRQPSFTLVFAALLHDVGKPETMNRSDRKLTFHDHEHAGCRIAASVGRRLKLSNDDRDRIEWLVEFHMYLGGAKQMRLAKLKRILVHSGIDELLALHRADALASTGDTAQVDYCERLLREMPDAELNPQPLLTGHDLVRLLGLEPGPQFKELLDKVREAQLDLTIHSKKDALALVQQLLGESEPPESA